MSRISLSTSGYFYLLIGLLILSACQEKSNSNTTESADTSISFSQKSAKETGIDSNNHIEEKYETFFNKYAYIYTGGGVAVGDLNNDGLQDVYFTGNEVSDKLYINKGNFKFEDVTEAAISSGQEGWHNGVTILDINGDGWKDIYVCRGGWKETPKERRNLLYINNGNG
ncbi:MAG: VCBS repeat-containing protein, partial [Bacteroidota bacterium]